MRKRNGSSNDKHPVLTISENINIVNCNGGGAGCAVVAESESSLNVNVKIHCNVHDPPSQITATPSAYDQLAGFSPSKLRPQPSIFRPIITNTPSAYDPEPELEAVDTSQQIMRLCSSEPPPSLTAQREHRQMISIPPLGANVIVPVDHTILAALSTKTPSVPSITPIPSTKTAMSSPPDYPPPQMAIYHLYPQSSASKLHSLPPTNPVIPRSQSLSLNERHQIKEITDQHQNRSSFSNSGSEQRRIMLMDEDQSDDSSDDGIAIVHAQVEGQDVADRPPLNDVRRSVSMHNVLRDTAHPPPGGGPKIRGGNLSADFNVTPRRLKIKAESVPTHYKSSRWRPRQIATSMTNTIHTAVTTPDLNMVIDSNHRSITTHKHSRGSSGQSHHSKADSTSPIKIKWPTGHDHDYAHVITPSFDPSLKRLSWSMETDMKVPLKWLMHRRSVSRSRSKREEEQQRKRQKRKRVKSIQQALTDQRRYRKISVDSTTTTHSAHSTHSVASTEESEHRLQRGVKRKHIASKSMGFHSKTPLCPKQSVSSFSESTQSTEPRKRRRVKHSKLRGKEKRVSDEMGSIDERGALMHQSPSTSDTEEFVPSDLKRPTVTKTTFPSPPPARSRSMSLNTSMSAMDGTDRAVSVDSSLGTSIQIVEKQLFDTLRKLSSGQLVSGHEKGSYTALRMKDRQSMESEEGPEGGDFHHRHEGKQ